MKTKKTVVLATVLASSSQFIGCDAIADVLEKREVLAKSEVMRAIKQLEREKILEVTDNSIEVDLGLAEEKMKKAGFTFVEIEKKKSIMSSPNIVYAKGEDRLKSFSAVVKEFSINDKFKQDISDGGACGRG